MAVERSNCASCVHVKVCKLMDDYEDISRQACHMDVKEPFRIVITCPYYSQAGINSRASQCTASEASAIITDPIMETK